MDPLETRLRESLRDDRWRVPADTDMLDRVHSGVARRRQRRKTLVVAAATVVVAGAGAGGIGYLAQQPSVSMTASNSAGGASVKEAPAQEQAPGDAKAGSADRRNTPEPGQSPTALLGQDVPVAPPKTKGVVSRPVPRGFSPVSFTARNPSVFWLLGDSKTAKSATVAVTTNGGKSFSALSDLGATVARGTNDVTADTVHDLRFTGDGLNAWAFGGGLWASHDGGSTWTRTTAVPGIVDQLETAAGSTYALARGDSGWSLWRTPAASDDWQRLDVDAHDPKGLAVVNGLVALTDRTETSTYAFVSGDDGKVFSQQPTPCSPDLDAGRLSATIGALWLTCPTGTAASVYVSTDAAASWTKVPTGQPAISATNSALGARTSTRAVVAEPGTALMVGTDGTDQTSVPGLGAPTYAGFTTDKVGYILDLSGQLFRTVDGGAGWSRVDIH